MAQSMQGTGATSRLVQQPPPLPHPPGPPPNMQLKDTGAPGMLVMPPPPSAVLPAMPPAIQKPPPGFKVSPAPAGTPGQAPLSAPSYRDRFDKDTVAYVTEDVRLSTLQKKLSRETNPTVSAALACQISESVSHPENRAYIKRATDILCDALVDVFFSKHSEPVRRESALALGRVGHVLTEQGDFDRFYALLWDGHNRAAASKKRESSQVYFLAALAYFLQSRPPSLSDGDARRVVADAQDLLEKTESGPVMLELTDCLRAVSSWRPRLFEPVFQDAVDILVGWHIDPTQPPSLRTRASEALLSWHSFWVVDMEFSSGLLRQFMEDLDSCAEDVRAFGEEDGCGDREDLRAQCRRVLSLVQVFNTVLSCLKSPQSSVSFLPPESSDWLAAILDCFLLVLDKTFDEDVVAAGQHSLVLLLERIGSSLFTRHEDLILRFVDAGVDRFSRTSFSGKAATVSFVGKMFVLVDQKNQDRMLASTILEPSSILTSSAMSSDPSVAEAAADLFRSLLNSKSILVLQEVYGHLLCLLEEALHRLGDVPRFLKKNKFQDFKFGGGKRRLRDVFFFVLSSLSSVIAAKGSVLSMWALDPSIFSLFNKHCGVATAEGLARREPWMHHALVKTLHSHCSNHGFFVASSPAVAQNSAAAAAVSSPTAHYLLESVKTLTALLRREEEWRMSPATGNLLADCAGGLIKSLPANSEYVFREVDEFGMLQKLLLDKTTKGGADATKTARLLGLLRSTMSPWEVDKSEEDELLEMRSALTFHLRSVCPEVRDLAEEMLLMLPPLLPDWSVRDGKAKDKILRGKTKAIIQKSRFRDYTAVDFKVFVEAILKGPLSPGHNQNKVRRQLEANHPASSRRRAPKDGLDGEAYSLALTHQDLRSLWMGLGVSQFCVANKLKTPLGKANETLTTIEKVIRNVVQSVRDNTAKVDHSECRNLLSFHRVLEICLRNAFDGAAAALPAPPAKAAAVFFAANKRTCLEWLHRMRSSVIELAFHAGDFDYVVQNAYDVLPRLAREAKEQQQQQQKDDQLTLVVAHLAAALTRLGHRDGLTGLYSWCRERAGRKYRWIRCLADIVAGGKEKALEQFQAVLKSESSLGVRDVALISQELYLGHLSLCRHEPYENFMKEFRSEQESKDSAPRLREEYLKALGGFEDGVVKLAEWKDLEEEGEKVLSPSTDDMVFSSHLLLLNVAACFQKNLSRLPSWSESEKMAKALQTTGERLTSLRRERILTGEAATEVAVLSKVNDELSRLVQNKPAGNLSSLFAFRERRHSSRILVAIKKWGEYFVKYRKGDPKVHFQVSALDLEIARQARKERNVWLSTCHLQRSLLGGGTLTQAVGMADFLRKLDFNSLPLSVDRADALRQCAKLCLASGDSELAVATVCGVANGVGAALYHHQQSPALLISSKALLDLSAWLGKDSSLLDKVYPDAPSSSAAATVSHILQLEQNLAGCLDFLPAVDAASDSDMVVGRILRLSLVQSPSELPKLWHAFGEWALSLGEKVLAAHEKAGGIALTQMEEAELAAVLPDADDLEEVTDLIKKRRLGRSEDDSGVVSSRFDYMRDELRSCRGLAKLADDVGEAALARVHAVWATAQGRAYHYYQASVSAFFRFVSLSDGSSEDRLLVAMLRLLQLTVRHPLELQESLQEGLESTPSARWRAIIPQLFSRLNHPVRAVRDRISDLLCRIAADFPQLIVFPAVVGAGEVASSEDDVSKLLLSRTGDEDDDDGEDREETVSKKAATSSTLQGAYSKILDSMKRFDEVGVEQTKRLVDELQRISLLWDELWLGTLMQHANDVSRRVRRMEEEAARLEANRTLSPEEKRTLLLDKYGIVFKPVLYVLEKIHRMTFADREPETPHERWFVRKYGSFVSGMMDKLRNPARPDRPREAWSALAQLQNNLGSRLQAQSALKFSDVAPALHAMRSTRVPMPGVFADAAVESIENGMSILPTKTKPKRIALRGSDGRRYTYLFKGLEDLHLDERVMQFLNISNVLMRRQKKEDGRRLRARHYSVIPLGPRSGLIQWVGGAAPMYALFKKWQQRQLLGVSDKPAVAAAAASSAAKSVAAQKPSERFYGKVYPLLKEEGVSLENRRSWPPALLRRAMRELLQETPSNILSGEVLFSSADAADWHRLTRELTVSFAVMSVIGYVIGLGDRHMDNLLLDLESGEVIHVDYNVCFEKGRNLRIPEQVPFRLTQNVVSLFGLTGVEGLFRNSCEATLEALKNGRETLMTLLEAFVYDPLVDWTPGVDMGVASAFYGGRQNDLGVDLQDKREMQTEITFSMFAVRVAEMKGAWTEHRGTLLAAVSALEDNLLAWTEVRAGCDALNDLLAGMHHSMSVLKEAEANPNHRLYTLHSRYVEHNLTETAVAVSQSRVDAFVEENDRWVHLHQRAVASVTGPQLAAWTAEVTAASTAAGAASRLVRPFLANAGQSALLEELESVEAGFCLGVEKLKQNLLACLQLLNHYFAVSSLYPRSYRQRHRSQLYARWAREISENFTVAKCHEVTAEFGRELAEGDRQAPGVGGAGHRALQVSLQMEAWAQEVNFRMQNVYQRMAQEKVEGGTAAPALAHLGAASLDLQQYLAGEPREVGLLLADLFVGRTLTGACRKLLSLETAAAAADGGQALLDLTSGDGEWFLADEIHMQVGLVTQVLDAMDFLGLCPSEIAACSALHKLQVAFKQLQHFNSSFFGIVLPEGLKSFQSEDPSALSLASDLTDIIGEAGLSLEDLMQELDVEIRYAAAGMPSSNEAAVNVARSVKARYVDLINKIGADCSAAKEAIKGASNDDSTAAAAQLTPGQMLFLAFDSLFNNVDTATTDLRASAAVASLEVPEEWRAGIDAVGQASTVAQQTSNAELFDLLDLAAFTNRLLVIKEYFSMCARSAVVFKCEPTSAHAAEGQLLLPTGDEVARPVKLFLVDFYRRQLAGAGSAALSALVCHYVQAREPALLTNLPPAHSDTKLSLEELSKAFVDRRLSARLPGRDRSRFLSLELDNLEAVMRKAEVAKYLEQNVEALQSSLQINQLQRNSFQWFHDDVLPNSEVAVVQPDRQTFLTELTNYIAILLTVNKEVTTGVQTRYRELHSTVEQRLKWACGANPDLQETFDAYTTSFVAQAESLRSLSAVLKSAAGAANAVLHHEALRTGGTRESVSADSTFMALLGDCQQSAALKETSSISALSEQELALFALSPPAGDVIDAEWIKHTEEAISTRVRAAREQLAAEQSRCRALVPSVQQAGKDLVRAVTDHQKLMADVGGLLRNISKSEDYDIPEVAAYLSTYKAFSDTVSGLVRDARQDEQTESSVRRMAASADAVRDLVPAVYTGILDFVDVFKEENLEACKTKKAAAWGQQQDQQHQSKNGGKDSSKSTEEKNAFALSVLRRVRLKLEGREPDALKRTGVPEQVDFIIREATSLDNLSLMYEGWTSWI